MLLKDIEFTHRLPFLSNFHIKTPNIFSKNRLLGHLCRKALQKANDMNDQCYNNSTPNLY